MVELTEVREDNTKVFEKEADFPAGSSNRDESVPEQDSSDEYSSDDEYDEEETFMERLSALKDIIPPRQRQTINKVFDTTVSVVRGAFSKSGNIAWAVTTSALLLGVPLSLSILAEQQLIEMEKSFDLQKDANDILVQGDGANAAPVGAIATA
ncbi:LANO_0E12442g1_1 [Lachancea nothofagi CBS 11611]|uniref:LANO_0E12442g1_1 n=1 Tax=Lachancea nothofagi CBS 11611 TaxID=1266666 RepID=A0A1G4JY73_9SACH|nr:LANO_0E12442g1_1 [Lachancea nothofagi CBS 11611]